VKPIRSCLLTIIAAALLATTEACTPTAFKPTATIAPTATTTPTIQPGDYERTLTVNGLERTYLLHIPPALDNRPVPVVLVFHGFGESASYARLTYGFDDIADTSSFMVVYPNGTGSSPSWNAGMCCGYAVINSVDEAAFIRQILSDLGTIARIDPKRIYAAGFDNGAMLSYRLACEMSGTFAAIAPVAGVLLYYGPCQPQQPVSVMHVHGLSDTKVPYAGGGLPGFGAEYSPVAYGIATWVQLDGCPGSAQVTKGGIVTHTVYASCRAGTAVELYAIAGLGHTWPSVYGTPLSKMIWDFFAGHPKP
jgi:polyhydroxybutyrate depolymerase